MANRTWSQCAQRWTKVLNPKIVKGPWTQEVCSDTAIPELVIVVGSLFHRLL